MPLSLPSPAAEAKAPQLLRPESTEGSLHAWQIGLGGAEEEGSFGASSEGSTKVASPRASALPPGALVREPSPEVLSARPISARGAAVGAESSRGSDVASSPLVSALGTFSRPFMARSAGSPAPPSAATGTPLPRGALVAGAPASTGGTPLSSARRRLPSSSRGRAVPDEMLPSSFPIRGSPTPSTGDDERADAEERSDLDRRADVEEGGRLRRRGRSSSPQSSLLRPRGPDDARLSLAAALAAVAGEEPPEGKGESSGKGALLGEADVEAEVEAAEEVAVSPVAVVTRSPGGSASAHRSTALPLSPPPSLSKSPAAEAFSPGGVATPEAVEPASPGEAMIPSPSRRSARFQGLSPLPRLPDRSRGLSGGERVSAFVADSSPTALTVRPRPDGAQTESVLGGLVAQLDALGDADLAAEAVRAIACAAAADGSAVSSDAEKGRAVVAENGEPKPLGVDAEAKAPAGVGLEKRARAEAKANLALTEAKMAASTAPSASAPTPIPAPASTTAASNVSALPHPTSARLAHVSPPRPAFSTRPKGSAPARPFAPRAPAGGRRGASSASIALYAALTLGVVSLASLAGLAATPQGRLLAPEAARRVSASALAAQDRALETAAWGRDAVASAWEKSREGLGDSYARTLERLRGDDPDELPAFERVAGGLSALRDEARRWLATAASLATVRAQGLVRVSRTHAARVGVKAGEALDAAHVRVRALRLAAASAVVSASDSLVAFVALVRADGFSPRAASVPLRRALSGASASVREAHRLALRATRASLATLWRSARLAPLGAVDVSPLLVPLQRLGLGARAAALGEGLAEYVSGLADSIRAHVSPFVDFFRARAAPLVDFVGIRSSALSDSRLAAGRWLSEVRAASLDGIAGARELLEDLSAASSVRLRALRARFAALWASLRAPEPLEAASRALFESLAEEVSGEAAGEEEHVRGVAEETPAVWGLEAMDAAEAAGKETAIEEGGVSEGPVFEEPVFEKPSRAADVVETTPKAPLERGGLEEDGVIDPLETVQAAEAVEAIDAASPAVAATDEISTLVSASGDSDAEPEGGSLRDVGEEPPFVEDQTDADAETAGSCPAGSDEGASSPRRPLDLAYLEARSRLSSALRSLSSTAPLDDLRLRLGLATDALTTFAATLAASLAALPAPRALAALVAPPLGEAERGPISTPAAILLVTCFAVVLLGATLGRSLVARRMARATAAARRGPVWHDEPSVTGAPLNRGLGSATAPVGPLDGSNDASPALQGDLDAQSSASLAGQVAPSDSASPRAPADVVPAGLISPGDAVFFSPLPAADEAPVRAHPATSAHSSLSHSGMYSSRLRSSRLGASSALSGRNDEPVESGPARSHAPRGSARPPLPSPSRSLRSQARSLARSAGQGPSEWVTLSSASARASQGGAAAHAAEPAVSAAAPAVSGGPAGSLLGSFQAASPGPSGQESSVRRSARLAAVAAEHDHDEVTQRLVFSPPPRVTRSNRRRSIA